MPPETNLEMARVSTGAEAVTRHDAAIGQSGLVAIEQARAVQEVQAKLLIAKRFQRNETQAIVDITQACKRPTLAKVALYSYERGGTKIQGPSIRLAEVIARAWGNMDFGIRELTQGEGYSDVEAYAWDLQTNVTAIRSFKVQHRRYTKAKGAYDLEDPRDIYETVANNGARRMRACILEIIPGDVVEDAVNQIRQTLLQAGRAEGPIEDRIKKMALAFNGLGVPVDAIEERLKHKIDITTEDELVELLAIYNSLKDGMAKRKDFFAIENAPTAFSQTNQPLKWAGGESSGPPAAAKPAEEKAPPPQGVQQPPAEEKKAVEAPKEETKRQAQQQPSPPTGGPTPEEMKAKLQADPFSCPKTGEPLTKVDCEKCEVISTCQAMSAAANPAPPPAQTQPSLQQGMSASAPPPPATVENKQEKVGGRRPIKNKDASLVCGYAKMESLHGRNVYMKYCQENCRHRAECPSLKEHGGPTK